MSPFPIAFRNSWTNIRSPLSLPVSKITNPDVTRIINSDEIQSVVREAKSAITKRPYTQKKSEPIFVVTYCAR